MIAETLKKSILQAAIQGKLTEQLPEDGDARDLLKEIKKEKERLVKVGKIKKEKPLPEIKEEEKPFDIPENWCWVRLGECLDVRDGTHDTPKYVSQGVPLVTGKNISNGVLDLDNVKFITNHDADKINKRSEVLIGDILFAMIGSIGNPVLVKNNKQFCIKNLALFKNIGSKLNMEYVLEYLRLAQHNLRKESSGGVQSFISLQYFRMYLLPLPPLSEQKRIVDQIEKLFPETDELKEDEVKLEELQKVFPKKMKDSILQYAIRGKLTEQLPEDGDARELLEEIKKEKERLVKEGKIKKEKPLPEIKEEEKPFDIPENWCWVRLGEIGLWSAGITPSRDRTDFYMNGTVPWIKTGDLNDGLVTESSESITEKALNETGIVLRDPGTVLIALYGATIGKLGLLKIEATMNQACCGCTTYSGVLNKYLFYFLMFQKESFKKQSFGGAQPNISKAKVIMNLFPLPPLSEQKRIVERLEQLLPLCDSLD